MPTLYRLAEAHPGTFWNLANYTYQLATAERDALAEAYGAEYTDKALMEAASNPTNIEFDAFGKMAQEIVRQVRLGKNLEVYGNRLAEKVGEIIGALNLPLGFFEGAPDPNQPLQPHIKRITEKSRIVYLDEGIGEYGELKNIVARGQYVRPLEYDMLNSTREKRWFAEKVVPNAGENNAFMDCGDIHFNPNKEGWGKFGSMLDGVYSKIIPIKVGINEQVVIKQLGLEDVAQKLLSYEM